MGYEVVDGAVETPKWPVPEHNITTKRKVDNCIRYFDLMVLYQKA